MRGRRIENVPEDREAAAVYIADLAADLARMARRQGLDTLGYLLDMARLEARNAAGLDSSGGEELTNQ
jgi:hypothetical protein